MVDQSPDIATADAKALWNASPVHQTDGASLSVSAQAPLSQVQRQLTFQATDLNRKCSPRCPRSSKRSARHPNYCRGRTLIIIMLFRLKSFATSIHGARSNGFSPSTLPNSPGRCSATGSCDTGSLARTPQRAVETALRRVDVGGMPPDLQDVAEIYTIRNPLDWQLDPSAAVQIEARLRSYGFDQHTLNMETYVQAREILSVFEALLNGIQLRPLLLLKEINHLRRANTNHVEARRTSPTKCNSRPPHTNAGAIEPMSRLQV